MKWMILALILLVSCAPAVQDVATKPVVQPEQKQVAPAPVLEPVVKAPVETVKEPVAPVVKEEPKPQLSPIEQCKQSCVENCKSTAQSACTQNSRADCRAMCGDNQVIDPSACTQACAYVPNQGSSCKQMMENFCSNQCVKACY